MIGNYDMIAKCSNICPQVNKLKTLYMGTLDRKESALIEWISWPMRFYSFANDSIHSHLLLKEPNTNMTIVLDWNPLFFFVEFFFRNNLWTTNHHAFTSFKLLPSSNLQNSPKYKLKDLRHLHVFCMGYLQKRHAKFKSQVHQGK